MNGRLRTGAPLALLFALVFASACDDDGRRPGSALDPAVEVIPEAITLRTSQSVDFDVIVTGADTDEVEWRIVNDPAPGSITGDGVYTAPDTVPVPPLVLIEAELLSSFPGVGRAEVTIVPPATGVLPER